MTNFTPEMIEKAKAAKTAEELLALAKEAGTEMSEEEAKAYFAQLGSVSGELSDDELDNVAGGGCGGAAADNFELGDRVKILDGLNYKCKVCGSNTGSFIRYTDGKWGVMCDGCNDGTLVVLAEGSINPAGTIKKI